MKLMLFLFCLCTTSLSYAVQNSQSASEVFNKALSREQLLIERNEVQRLKPRVDAIGKRLFGLDINKTTYEIKMYNDGARIFVYDSNITCLFKQGARANTIILNSFDDEPTLDSIQCLKR